MKNVTKKKNGAEPKNKKQMESVSTLLQAIEHVVELSKNSKMSEEFMMEASPEIALQSDRYGITGRQAVLFCICMEKGPNRVDYDDIASHLDLSKIRVLSYANDIDALVRRRLLRYRERSPHRNPIFPQSPKLPLYKERTEILPKLRRK